MALAIAEEGLGGDPEGTAVGLGLEAVSHAEIHGTVRIDAVTADDGEVPVGGILEVALVLDLDQSDDRVTGVDTADNRILIAGLRLVGAVLIGRLPYRRIQLGFFRQHALTIHQIYDP